ncbi:MAG: phage tail protein [Flavobacteriales bacterium]|jgi:phage tail-like protein|nr:phage tail protein [Flavobacteriales bacterium]
MALNYPVSFYFKLSFKGEDAAFQEVSGLSKELAVEEVTCGGENRFKYRLPTIASGQNLVLKRAVVTKGSQLLGWCSTTMDQGLAKAVQPHDVTVSLLNAKGTPSRSWTFHNAYPIKYALSDFKSTENSVLIETIELAYTYFEVGPQKKWSKLFN